MTRSGPLSDEQKRQILATVEELLNEHDLRVDLSVGVRFWNNYDTGQREASPTTGRTLTIAVNGGAQEIEESPADELARLAPDLAARIKSAATAPTPPDPARSD
jgi:hypothetical protein